MRLLLLILLLASVAAVFWFSLAFSMVLGMIAVTAVAVIGISGTVQFISSSLRGTAGGKGARAGSGDHAPDAVDPVVNRIQERVADSWKDVETHLADLSALIQRRLLNARRFWFKHKLEKFIQSEGKIFDFLAQKMRDDDLEVIRGRYLALCERIGTVEQSLADIRATIAMGSEPAGGPNHRAGENKLVEIARLERARQDCIEQTREKLIDYGVSLTAEEARVLLSRVDAEDIIVMTTVFAVVSAMTEQLAKLKQSTGENLEVAKKYYGMYMALLELQLHIQSAYILKLREKFIPGLNSIRKEAADLYKETGGKLKSSDETLRAHYENNLKSQTFTGNVIAAYTDVLRADLDKVMKAKRLIQKHHEVAENTLKTVQVSADLSIIVGQGEQLFHHLMELQAPELVPFENLQMQREFEAVTARLK